MKYNYPLTREQTLELIARHPTPFHLYDEQMIRDNASRLRSVFAWMPGFINYFAVKALPNPFILKVLKECGMGADCSSLAELMLAEQAGILGENIMFSSNNTPAEEFMLARKLRAIINLDDLSHIDYLEKSAGLPELLSFRYNPGPLKAGNAIIGQPEEAKYGLTGTQLIEAFRIARQRGVKRFGLHTMLASNELNEDYHVATAKMLFEMVVEINHQTGIQIEFVDLGGGYGVPYRPEQEELDLEKISQGIRREYDHLIVANGLAPLKICMENGRMVTGPFGWLVTRVRHLKHIYRDYVGLDASMADLMRPGIYGAYHHITVPGKETQPHDHKYDVTGSLCENNDKFAIGRMLPPIEVGDIVVIHTTGAHGHAMGFNYNGQLRSAELLRRSSGEISMIRRAESINDYFATLDFSALKNFLP
ncbi:MAG TPA: diaminopimelate decarboxylase [Candidatus Rifleibacterium sp.]|nr:diaminopimelate decarboxylase [Candidatus Rifleibacterium sp.]HPT47925.1 diaminopimelate decarboxylase [Candidatus Rifleibacterium sp.]